MGRCETSPVKESPLDYDNRIIVLGDSIGGLELGLERAGIGRTVWQVERDAYCRHVLARHWPDAHRFDDVRTVGAHNLPPVDVICGGFPCTDLSAAGKMAGLGTEDNPTARSGLWFEMRRIIAELRPAIVVVENVGHTWRRYVPVVRLALHELGYASVPVRVRACDVGARHERARVFVVGRLDSDTPGLGRGAGWAGRLLDAARRAEHPDGAVADPHDHGELQSQGALAHFGGWTGNRAASDPDGPGLAHGERIGVDSCEAIGTPAERDAGLVSPGFGLPPCPWMVRGVHELPGGVDSPWRRAGWSGARLRTARIHALGNSVVPACAEVVGRLISLSMLSQDPHAI